MATTVFTTWSDLYDQMLDQLASQNFTQSEFRVGDRTFKFRSTDDIVKQLNYVKGKKEEEEQASSSITGYGVIHMGNAGRGFA